MNTQCGHIYCPVQRRECANVEDFNPVSIIDIEPTGMFIPWRLGLECERGSTLKIWTLGRDDVFLPPSIRYFKQTFPQPQLKIQSITTNILSISMAAPETMRAWQFTSTTGGIDKTLTYNTTASPPPSTKLSSGQLLVEVISMALNPVDYKLPEVPLVGGLVVGKPSSPGLDYSGRIVTTGPDCSFRPGQLIFGRLDSPTKFGTLGQYIIANQAGAAPIPSGTDPDQAAAIGTAGLTAYQAIVPFAHKGDHIFIHGGSGGTGTYGIQIAKAIGCHVTTTCSSTNVQLCQDLGADEVIDYKTSDPVQVLQSKGPVFTLVVDFVGTPANLYKASDAFLKPGGRYIQVGAGMSIGGVWTIVSRMFWPTVLGGGKHHFEFLGVSNKREDFDAIAKLIEEGRVKSVIDQIFETDEAKAAYSKLRTGRARGKIVVRVGER